MAKPATATECSIVGVFDSPETANRVREELIRSGFYPNQVHIRSPKADTERERATFWQRVRDYIGPSDSTLYEEAESHGRGVVVIEGPNDEAWVKRAGLVMQRYSPIELGESSATRAPAPEHRAAPKPGEARIPVAHEQLNVGKRRTISGGVRVYSRVTEVPVEKDVELTEEHVHVERRPADAPAGPDTFREQTVEATETREEPVVSKEAKVTEEVVVRKEGEKRREKVRDTVRRQDVEVERTEDEPPPPTKQPPSKPPK